ncbi:hypothetical protein DBV08_00355 [Rhodococcus sp. KBW08]|uniref:hypothetical protein n=1 Tax=Rhodococcus sp. KBW08 TaxID=2144188 RepID=UPI000F5B4738|nr:hypothetical protein [Rhodococcus sp. KBW08]RQO52785.1 hypothetical protein DBV08_00355 [Rhodococcus sp. KBW08]
MKRVATLVAGILIFLAGLLGVWSTVAFVDLFATPILVIAAMAFAVLIAVGAGLVIRTISS